MAKTLLLISENAQDLEFAQRVSKIAELDLKAVKTANQAIDLIKDDNTAVIFTDISTESLYRKFEELIDTEIGLFSDKINPNAIHFISGSPLEKNPYAAESPLFGHYVSRNYKNPVEAGDHYGRFVKIMTSGRPFGLEKLLGKNASVQTKILTNSLQKQPAVEAVKGYLVKAKFQSRTVGVIANAVDEILMNAIFDAPTDPAGKPLYSTTLRTAQFELNARQTVQMQIGFDGKYVAITARDLFGSLEKKKLLNHISKTYIEEEYKVKNAVAGAGIGLATIFQSGGSFIFLSDAQEMTEVTVLFKRCDNFREFREQFNFISTQFYFGA